MTALDLFAPSRRATKCERLRALLSDGQWHHIRAMMDAGGTRFGGRLRELRIHPTLPMDHEVRTASDGATWYRRKA